MMAAALCGLIVSAYALPASADELVMPPAGEMPPHPVILPHRGEHEATVLKEFGEPRQRHAPVGGGSPKHPPITRWDYDGYSVFFERTTVVDVVVKGDPPPISHVDELKRTP
ncbi:hypothetical protein G7Y85_18920 [Solimonas terrae]|uniref:Phosphodiesterase n=2 Tax=Solimonas terrae TaxID=1396819 RepID=A0A6M2BXE8_9GAMM|nr:hypothetical protein [Solimonas terrae]